MIKVLYACGFCPETWAGREHRDDAREHMNITGHGVRTYEVRYFDSRASCDTCISWPCHHTRPAPVVDETTIGAPTRFPGTPLKSGLVLCEKHAEERSHWTSLDPASDAAKRLVRPGINLVQIGSPAVQLKHGENYLDAFRRIIRDQVAVTDAICARRTACADLVPLEDIDPRQHCLSDRCASAWMDHRITYCLEIQWERCTCRECEGLYA